MKSPIAIFCLLLEISMTGQTELRVIEWEAFDVNEKFFELDYASTADGLIFNVNGSSIRTIDSIVSSIKLFKIDENKQFRQLYKNFPEFDWCKIMKTARQYSKNVFAKAALMFVQKLAPELIRQCPYPPTKLQRKNLTFPHYFTAIIPLGVYRVMFHMKYKNEIMFNTSVTGEAW